MEAELPPPITLNPSARPLGIESQRSSAQSSQSCVAELLSSIGIEKAAGVANELAAQGVHDMCMLRRLSYSQLRECKLSVADAIRLRDELHDECDIEELLDNQEAGGAPSTASSLAAGLNYLALVSVILCSMAGNYHATYLGEMHEYLSGPNASGWMEAANTMMFSVQVLTLYATFVYALHAYYTARRMRDRSLKLHRKLARLATLVSTVLFAITIVVQSVPFVERWCDAVSAIVAAVGVLGILFAAWDFYMSGVKRVRTQAAAGERNELRQERRMSEQWNSSRRPSVRSVAGSPTLSARSPMLPGGSQDRAEPLLPANASGGSDDSRLAS